MTESMLQNHIMITYPFIFPFTLFEGIYFRGRRGQLMLELRRDGVKGGNVVFCSVHSELIGVPTATQSRVADQTICLCCKTPRS